ncbi:TIGR04168 family protein [Leptolyngbya sp. BL0902]|uniref:TIGR04168 family protein n=1 Tax=Leptolyngbya sp. BL0902 TaxID=1115757 RepID=UPI0018E83A60|nr:TIGR04168 family protein [Leptolyngbya sp. BL0902]QQE65239.1 TIGR04168 family protein [Leptolyngbya sp. BL0902]
MTSVASAPIHTNRAPAPLTLAVVGDVHDQWSEADALALHRLGVDLVLFVGDFGNEAVALVRQVAALDLPKAVILGNHDAWYSATPWGQKKCPYNRQQEDWVAQQLQDLGHCHVGYGHLDLPQLGLSVVGGRPFSWGGSTWTNAPFYAERYGVNSWEASIERLCDAVNATAYDNLIFIGHSGPQGLGAAPEDPCGRDWNPIGSDYGDPDLAAAIAYAKQSGKTVPLVAFGHMHHTLRHRKDRLRRQIHSAGATVYLNAARVPRWRQQNGVTQRHFSLVTLQANQVTRARQVWVDDQLGIVDDNDLMEPSLLHQALTGTSPVR